MSWGEPDGEAAIYGMTDQPAVSLAELARSWNYPAKMTIKGSAFTSEDYDYTQRAYVIKASKTAKSLKLKFAASRHSPLFNLALVVKDWGPSKVTLMINEQQIARGKDFRYGIEYDVEGNPSFITWMKIRAKQDTEISLNAHEY